MIYIFINAYLLLYLFVLIAVDRNPMWTNADHRHSIISKFTMKHFLAKRVKIGYFF